MLDSIGVAEGILLIFLMADTYGYARHPPIEKAKRQLTLCGGIFNIPVLSY